MTDREIRSNASRKELHRSWEDGRKSGIREVVEWLKNNSQEQNSYWHSNLFAKIAINKGDLEAKLKELGIGELPE